MPTSTMGLTQLTVIVTVNLLTALEARVGRGRGGRSNWRRRS
jgi:hypothetical protein